MQLSQTNRACGIVYNQSLTELYLPLEDAQVHANIVDVSAIVTVTQHFWQYAPSGLQNAKYVFPLPTRAAICGFEMTVGDTTITAVAKEKEEARREHNLAITQGYMTGLVEHVTDDIFSISLGALPGKQMVTTQVTYVLDLMEDDVADEVRLQLPMYIGYRFGQLPDGMEGARKFPPHRVRISVDVHMQGVVRKITSPTHPTFTFTTKKSVRIPANAQYNSRNFLEQDFVLIITADGLDAPRCFAQQTPDGTVAMQLNIVPKFGLTPIPKQEYIFLVDRSASMHGSRIKMAKQTLVMLLRALPSQGTWFNILSFGNYCDELWTRSVLYDERSMERATRHVDSMEANYGGTNLEDAIDKTLRSRKMDIPTAVFVLTDGESYGIAKTLNFVKDAVVRAKDHPVRVFTLGIGQSASSETCEGIARTGNGICLMATTSESIVGKCSRLVRASRSHVYHDVSVDWGIKNAHVDFQWAPNSNSKAVSQAPFVLPSMYSGNRFIAFALAHLEKLTLPKEVIVQAKKDGSEDVLRFTVPVQVVDLANQYHPRPLIHTLAARRAIMELEDMDKSHHLTHNRSTIISLGIKYQLVSTYTSFVAVDKRTKLELRDPPAYEEYPREEYSFSLSASGPRPAALIANPFIPSLSSATGSSSAKAKKRSSLQLPTIGRMFKSSSSPQASQRAAEVRASFSQSSTTMFQPAREERLSPATSRSSRFLPQLFHRTTSSSTTRSPSPTAPVPMTYPRPPAFNSSMAFIESYDPHAHYDPIIEDPSLLRQEEYGSPRRSQGPPASSFITLASPPLPVPTTTGSTEDKVVALIRRQTFDGCFPANIDLLDLLGGSKLLAEAKKLGVAENVWTTVLSVSYLKVHMKDQPDLLESIVEKAMDFLSRTPNLDVDALLQRARKLLAD